MEGVHFSGFFFTMGAWGTETFKHGVNSSSLVIRWLVLGIGVVPGDGRGDMDRLLLTGFLPHEAYDAQGGYVCMVYWLAILIALELGYIEATEEYHIQILDVYAMEQVWSLCNVANQAK
ncbi:hypothetical protein J3458_004764 [Metarhizium acridum]|uniref:uncharacterized protein n=1 Tax=Metarhizium acridum TaxID=92637 RepID=UPI001C6C23CA|nr:hypothetical protein J3458_004764 [Metarhizium acridum]